jgi:hypothetical protein
MFKLELDNHTRSATAMFELAGQTMRVELRYHRHTMLGYCLTIFPVIIFSPRLCSVASSSALDNIRSLVFHAPRFSQSELRKCMNLVEWHSSDIVAAFERGGMDAVGGLLRDVSLTDWVAR